MNAACAATAATVNIIVNEQLTAAESAVAQAASHLELMRELAGQAHVVANKHHVLPTFKLIVASTPHLDHPLPHRRALSIGGAP